MTKQYCPHCYNEKTLENDTLLEVVQVEFSNIREHGYYWCLECPNCGFRPENVLFEIVGLPVLTYEQEKLIRDQMEDGK